MPSVRQHHLLCVAQAPEVAQNIYKTKRLCTQDQGDGTWQEAILTQASPDPCLAAGFQSSSLRCQAGSSQRRTFQAGAALAS